MQEFFEKNLGNEEIEMKSTENEGRNETEECDIVLVKGGDRITDKQKKFADAYIREPNATKAYMEAYNVTDREAASKRGSALKRNGEVKEYIEKAFSEVSRKARAEAENVLELLCDIAFTSPASFAKIESEGGKQKIVWEDISNLPDDVKNAIATVKNTPGGIVVETLDRMKAIDMLMKYMGIKQSGEGGVVFEGEKDIV